MWANEGAGMLLWANEGSSVIPLSPPVPYPLHRPVPFPPLYLWAHLHLHLLHFLLPPPLQWREERAGQSLRHLADSRLWQAKMEALALEGGGGEQQVDVVVAGNAAITSKSDTNRKGQGQGSSKEGDPAAAASLDAPSSYSNTGNR